MNTLRQNWWKLLVIVLIVLLVRVLLLRLLPLKTSSTFELAPSVFSQSIGLIPVAAIVITISYTVIASVLIIIQENLYGTKLKRLFLCSLPFSFIWFMGVLESVSSLGKPLCPELLIGLTDILPILILGAIISVWFQSVEQQNTVVTSPSMVLVFLSSLPCILLGDIFYIVRSASTLVTFQTKLRLSYGLSVWD